MADPMDPPASAPRTQPVFFPLGAIAVAAAGHLLGGLAEMPTMYWPGSTLLALGIGVLAWALSVQMAAGNNPEVHQPTRALVTSGPYGFTRNPVYLGFLAAQAGIGLMTGWWLAWLLVPLTGMLIHINIVLPEERQLEAAFGEDYDAYRSRVRRWL